MSQLQIFNVEHSHRETLQASFGQGPNATFVSVISLLLFQVVDIVKKICSVKKKEAYSSISPFGERIQVQSWAARTGWLVSPHGAENISNFSAESNCSLGSRTGQVSSASRVCVCVCVCVCVSACECV